MCVWGGGFKQCTRPFHTSSLTGKRAEFLANATPRGTAILLRRWEVLCLLLRSSQTMREVGICEEKAVGLTRVCVDESCAHFQRLLTLNFSHRRGFLTVSRHTWDLPYYDLWGDQKPRLLRPPKTAHKLHINSPNRNILNALTLRNSVLSFKSISVEIGGAGRRKAGPRVSGKASPREKQTDSGCFGWQQQCLCVSPVLRSVIE